MEIGIFRSLGNCLECIVTSGVSCVVVVGNSRKIYWEGKQNKKIIKNNNKKPHTFLEEGKDIDCKL